MGSRDMRDRIAGLEQRTFLRYALGVAIGLCVTILLFLLMDKLIESDRNPYSEPPKGKLLSFVRLLEEPPPPARMTPPPPVVEEPPPPPDLPELPPGEVCAGIECGVPLGPPSTRPPKVIGTGVASDGEFLPIIKVAPEYPRTAASRGIEGYVLLEFTVTSLGSVRDPVVIDARPPGVFDRAATAASLKFRYKPRVLNGEPVDVRGVRNLIRFELEDAHASVRSW